MKIENATATTVHVEAASHVLVTDEAGNLWRIMDRHYDGLHLQLVQAGDRGLSGLVVRPSASNAVTLAAATKR